MIYAFNPSNYKLSNHGKNYGYFTIKLNADGSCGGGTSGGGSGGNGFISNMKGVSTIHGWIMWTTWSVIALL
jgi:hypothetical protein